MTLPMMIRELRNIALLAAAAAIAGCASANTVNTGYEQRHVTVDAPGGRFDLLLTRDNELTSDTLALAPTAAWKGLVQTYAGLGAPLQGADGQHYMIATLPFHAHGNFAGERMSRWIDCGQTITGDIASSYEITLRFGTLIDTSDAGRSIVRTAFDATAISPGSGTTPVQCTSRGAFEKRIASLVASKAM
jgi:hypothetical protein